MSQSISCILDFIRHLLSAFANASLFGMDHPQVARLTDRAFESLIAALEERHEFSLVIIENELVIDGQPQTFNLFIDRFAQTLSLRNIGHIKLIRGISKQEVTEFIAAMACKGAEAAQKVASSEHLRLGRIDLKEVEGYELGERSGHSGSAESGDLASFGGSTDKGGSGSHRKSGPINLQDLPAEEMARFREIYDAVKLNHKLKINSVSEIVSDFIAAFHQEGRSLLIMAALREKDEYTFTHSTNVCILNLAQAMALGIDGQLLNDIGVAGMLHDIGKLFVPEELISKKGALTNAEFELMQTHPVKGARFLLDTPGVPRLAIINAFEHHLKYNLSGYPRVPAGWNQNICSQMTAISDLFDAMRTRRSYSEPVEPSNIANVMLDKLGTELHPVLTKNFLVVLSRLLNP